MTLKLGFGVTKGHRMRHHEIGRPPKFDPRSKHHVDRQNGCEVVAIFVYLTWPSAAILDFVEPQIAPFDPPTPKTLEPNMEWIGCTVCEIFAFIFDIHYTLTLKLGFGVTQGHRKWHYSIEHIRLYIRLPQYMYLYMYLLPFPRYSRILVENCYPLVFGAPLGVKPSDLRNDPWWRKTRMMVLSDGERISMIRSAVLIQYTRVTDRPTDGRNCSGTYAQ